MTLISGKTLGVACAVLAIIGLAACSPKTAVRGSMPTKDKIGLLAPGVHGQDDVREILGSPSVISTFDAKTWYYIGRHTTQYAFLERNTVSQQILIVRFDGDGRINEITRLDKSHGREVDLAKRETPSAGRKLGFFEQLFGNFGRFAVEEGGQ